jgi:FkbM family methyltransferase
VIGVKKLLSDLAIAPRGVVYAGAHHGELVPELLDCGFERLLLVEPNPDAFAVIEKLSDARIRCVRAALVEHAGPVTYWAAPKRFDIWSSVFEPNTEHFARLAQRAGAELRFEKMSVEGATLDDLVGTSGAFNVLYMNIQGAELSAVKGGLRSLSDFDVIGCEVDFVPRYRGAALCDELASWLARHDFHLAGQWRSPDPENDYGTACFVRASRLAS